jgi:hypothetical protein
METGNIAKAGSNLPLKFSLGGDMGMDVFATPPSVTPCGGGEILPAEGKLIYDEDSMQYLFNWKTLKAWKGTCQVLTLEFVDGTTMMIEVTFR